MTLKELRLPALLLTGLCLAAAVTAHAKVTETLKQSYPLTADGTVSVENVNGDIDIVAWDKAEVSLEAETRAKDDENLKRIHVKVDASATRFAVKTEYEKKSGWFKGNVDGSVRYKLMVPAGAKLAKIEAVNSDIRVSGVRGTVTLETVNGEIQATGLAADAHLESVNGSLAAEFASFDQVQSVHLESVNGRASVTLPKGAGARLDADSVNGRVSVDQSIKLGKVGRHALSGEINGGGAKVSLETVNGGISIKEKS